MKTFLVAAILSIALLVATPLAVADGTETLAPPSVAIAPGTGFAVGGAGMHAFPDLANTLNVDVPAGATVKQVLVYWEGHWTDHAPHPSNTPQVDGDGMITVGGIPVAGTKIGGSTAFFTQGAGAVDGTEKFVTYRADITGLNLVGPGANALSVNGMLFRSNFPAGSPFDQGNDGVGVLVVYDDGTDSTVAGVRDGLDLAFASFAPPLDTTVPQSFTFSPAPSPRPATLGTLAGSVSGPDLGGFRGNVLRVTFDVGGSFDIVDGWQSANGAEFDALSSPITIPAGAGAATVQALSQGGVQPASFSWIGAALAIENPPRGRNEGCTPGYWKNHDGSKKQTNQWPPTGYSPDQALATVFSPTGLGSLGSYTLRQALDFGGGSTTEAKKKNLLRIGVASLLNSSHTDISFPRTTAEVISQINAALESEDPAAIEALQETLDKLNNAGCPIGN